MNIFYLHNDPKICAEMHNNSHCVKMILETAQLLSTAHRLLDGNRKVIGVLASGKEKWVMKFDDARDELFYATTHMNHPSAIWCRQNNENYLWLACLLKELCAEYTFRYGKLHKCQVIGLVDALQTAPKNIPIGEFSEPTPAMPDIYKVVNDSITSYRNYYNGAKTHLAKWKNRSIPEWFQEQSA
jgi:hypothetical protein